jgi:4-amino-4-deoxy-L-arabinose transferase-like glycosyltransferase
MDVGADKKFKKDRQTIAWLSIILILTFLVRAPFLAEPFECDQAVFANLGWNWQNGKIIYKDIFDNKPPLVYLFVRLLINLFGYSDWGIHFGYAVLALFSTFVFYLLSKLFFRRAVALLGSFLYGLFSGGALISGSFANAENLMVFFVISAFYFFGVALQKENSLFLFISGNLIGLAMMAKQSALFEALAFALFLLASSLKNGQVYSGLKKTAVFWSGAILLIILCWGYFMAKGAGRDFLDSVFLYNMFFGRIVGIRQGLVNFWHSFFWTPRENIFLWVLAGLGLIFACLKRDGKSRLLILWLAASALGVVSSLRFYPHNFIQVIPALVLLASLYLDKMFVGSTILWRKYLAAGLLALALLSFMGVQWKYYFCYSPVDSLINRRAGLARPALYQEAHRLSALIKSNTKPNSCIYVWGLWPEIYFYSQRLPASKYFFIPSMGAMIGKMPGLINRQVLADTIKNQPEYFIIDYHFKDALGSPLREFLKQHYLLEAEIAGCKVLRRRLHQPNG